MKLIYLALAATHAALTLASPTPQLKKWYPALPEEPTIKMCPETAYCCDMPTALTLQETGLSASGCIRSKSHKPQ